MGLWSIVCEILERPTIWEVLSELSLLMTPLWVAVIVGVVVGWTWKPNWANFGTDFLHSPASKTASSSSFRPPMGLPFSVPSLTTFKLQLPSYVSWLSDDGDSKDSSAPAPAYALPELESDCRSFKAGKGSSNLVSNKDLEVLYKLVEEKDDGPAWIKMMDRSTATMGYQAWRRDLETGPPQYRSRTVFEDATPEMVRDLFWDDEFRMKWDDMLVSAETLEECPTTGTMMVKWVRKFPFFCSDREYIIGRRIWESGRLYYCVTRGVPNDVPRQNKPRRVDLYYSSWCIRAVESRRGDGQLTACEVLLFHYEDMGIPWEIAKLGVRQGMWGAVKKIEPALRRYQKERSSGASLSPSGVMAQINTKVSMDYLKSLEESSSNSPSETDTLDSPEKPGKNNIPKLLVVGGAIALACTLDRGLLTKAVIFGVARRFAKVGRRL